MDASSRWGRRGRVLRLPARRRAFSMHTLKAQGAPHLPSLSPQCRRVFRRRRLARCPCPVPT